MKKLLAALLCMTMAIATLTTLTACSPSDPSNSTGGGTTPAVVSTDLACVNIDINPSIELIVDKDSKVISVRGANDDGVLLLFNEQTVVGKPLDEALEIIIGYAAQYGFLTADNPIIGAIANSDDAELLATVKQAINTSITAASTSTGLILSVNLDGAFSLYRRLSELKARFPQNQAIQSLTVNKLRLALSVSETTGISLEAAIELDESRLLELIAVADQKIEEYAIEEFNENKQTALSIYDKVSAIEIYAAYAEIYASRAPEYLLTSYYGAAYQLYASAAAGFNALLEVGDVMREVMNYELDLEIVEEIAEIFGLADIEPLRGANGVVTIKSIEAYADKTFRSVLGGTSDAAVIDLTPKKQALTEALNRAEAAIRATIDNIAEEYVAQISKQIEQVQGVYNQVKPILAGTKEAIEIMAIVPGLKEAVEDLTAIMADFEEFTARLQALLKGETPSISEFEKIVSGYGEKAAKYLEKINADLTAAERAELAAKLEKIAEKHAAEKAELDAALEDARNQAIDFLTSTKSKLKEQLPGGATEIVPPDDGNEDGSSDGSKPDGTVEIVPPNDNNVEKETDDGAGVKGDQTDDGAGDKTDDKLIDADATDPNDFSDGNGDDAPPYERPIIN